MNARFWRSPAILPGWKCSSVIPSGWLCESRRRQSALPWTSAFAAIRPRTPVSWRWAPWGSCPAAAVGALRTTAFAAGCEQLSATISFGFSKSALPSLTMRMSGQNPARRPDRRGGPTAPRAQIFDAARFFPVRPRNLLKSHDLRVDKEAFSGAEMSNACRTHVERVSNGAERAPNARRTAPFASGLDIPAVPDQSPRISQMKKPKAHDPQRRTRSISPSARAPT